MESWGGAGPALGVWQGKNDAPGESGLSMAAISVRRRLASASSAACLAASAAAAIPASTACAAASFAAASCRNWASKALDSLISCSFADTDAWAWAGGREAAPPEDRVGFESAVLKSKASPAGGALKSWHCAALGPAASERAGQGTTESSAERGRTSRSPCTEAAPT